jgi:GDP-L-fucose synthase
MQNYDEAGFINIGTGHDITIKELALLIQKVVGFEGELVFDTSKPDGTPRKLMDVSRLQSRGWNHEMELEQGIRIVYEDFKNKYT